VFLTEVSVVNMKERVSRKRETPGREPDTHSLALSITTLFLSVFRAPLHTSFTLLCCVPGCLVKTTVQLIESRLTRASVCALAEINHELHFNSLNYSKKESKWSGAALLWERPSAGLVHESESLLGLMWSIEGKYFQLPCTG